MILSPMARDFIQHFGEMGSRWGINRISAQVFALLYLSPHPTDAEAICAALNFSRSHVGAALKDLEQWRLVSGRRSPGDRRDHFVAVDDVWEIARVLAEERRRRELEPTREMLRKTAAMRPRTAEERHQQKKIRAMHDILHLFAEWHDDVQTMETRQLTRLLKLGSKVASLYARTTSKNDKS